MISLNELRDRIEQEVMNIEGYVADAYSSEDNDVVEFPMVLIDANDRELAVEKILNICLHFAVEAYSPNKKE
jgi:hypothetical protein